MTTEWPRRYTFNWRAMKAFTISRARSLCGPGVATPRVLRQGLKRKLIGVRFGGFAESDLIRSDHSKAVLKKLVECGLPIGSREILPMEKEDRLQFYAFESQGQKLRIAYMLAEPEKSNGQSGADTTARGHFGADTVARPRPAAP
jgi:hypothetical protein